MSKISPGSIPVFDPSLLHEDEPATAEMTPSPGALLATESAPQPQTAKPPAPTMSGVVNRASSPEAQAQRAAAQAQADAAAGKKPSYDDLYWAKQPPEVQQLRYIDDPDERWKIGGELLAKGYKLDVPIMLWGWSPETTTGLRQAYGYTWVPHAMQESIKIAPGLSMPGVEAYDPNNPPPDSIIVDTSPVLPGIMMNDFTPAERDQQFDKSEFLNTRIAEANPPTTALLEQSEGSTTPMPPALLSDLDQVVALRQRLYEMGFRSLAVAEQPPAGGAKVNWGAEKRRAYSLGGVNVGLMLGQLARFPTDQAMQLIADQIRLAATTAK